MIVIESRDYSVTKFLGPPTCILTAQLVGGAVGGAGVAPKQRLADRQGSLNPSRPKSNQVGFDILSLKKILAGAIVDYGLASVNTRLSLKIPFNGASSSNCLVR